MADEILTAAEAAKVLKIARITVLRMIRRGDLKAGSNGRHYRILRSEIDKMLQTSAAKK